jgi:hypothetical protein
MTESTSPANAGSHTIGRQALPMLDDPVFQAIAALERLEIQFKEPDAAHSVAETAFIAAKRENVMVLDGEVMRTHEQIDAHFTPAFGPEHEEHFNRFVERLSPRHLSDSERAESDRARQAAHDELTRQEAAIAEVERRIGYRELEARKQSAERAVWDAEYEVMKAKPATTASAVTLLRFVAGFMEKFSGDNERGHYIEALGNAADFFEGRAEA